MIDKKQIILFCIFNLVFLKLYNQSFLYPVAFDEKSNAIYIIHQKSIYDIHLWTWNPELNLLKKAISADFFPCGVKLIPGANAFSFIDQGRLRIKQLQKRSVKTIDFFEPICDVNIVEWINDVFFYFSARKNKKFIICKSHITNPKIEIIVENENDCIYPKIINNELFYICRTIKNDLGSYKSNYKIIKKDLLRNCEKTILDKKLDSISFLWMKSSQEGFYLEHPTQIDRQEKIITFIYHHFFYNEGVWTDEVLFNFCLPIDLIFGNNDQRLHESILPLLPKHYNDKIFFSSKDSKNESSLLNIYYYDLSTKKLERKTESINDQVLFSPILINNKCYYGISIDQKLFELTDVIQADNSLLSFFCL